MLRFLHEDVDACLHTSVVEFLYASQHKREKAAREMNMQRAFQPMNMGEIMDLADSPLVQLYTLVTPDLAAQCLVRSCELLADIAHTHHLITQWHLAPFDPRNEECSFLHRSAYEEEEDDANEIVIDLQSKSKSKSKEEKGKGDTLHKVR